MVVAATVVLEVVVLEVAVLVLVARAMADIAMAVIVSMVAVATAATIVDMVGTALVLTQPTVHAMAAIPVVVLEITATTKLANLVAVTATTVQVSTMEIPAPLDFSMHKDVMETTMPTGVAQPTTMEVAEVEVAAAQVQARAAIVDLVLATAAMVVEPQRSLA